jgi:hypothetical protein
MTRARQANAVGRHYALQLHDDHEHLFALCNNYEFEGCVGEWQCVVRVSGSAMWVSGSVMWVSGSAMWVSGSVMWVSDNVVWAVRCGERCGWAPGGAGEWCGCG